MWSMECREVEVEEGQPVRRLLLWFGRVWIRVQAVAIGKGEPVWDLF